MKPNNDNDRKSSKELLRGKSCGRPIPVAYQNRNINLDLDFTAFNKEIEEISANIRRFLMSQEERDRLENDRRWATDPLELMDKIKEVIDFIIEVISFILIFLVALSD